MKLQPIAIETQIENVLFGTPQTETDRIKEKVKVITDNIEKVQKINGSRAYDVIVEGDNIYYNLTPIPEKFKKLFPNLLKVVNGKTQHTRDYYYPIQYAEIELIN